MFNLLARLAIHTILTLLYQNTSKHYFDPAGLPPAHRYFEKIFAVETDNRITPAGALRSALSGESYILSRFNSAAFAAKLAEVLQTEEFDVVQLETIYLAHFIPVIRRHSKAIIALRSHNVEHGIWERFARNSRVFWKKWYLQSQIQPLKKFEIEKTASADALVAITADDLGIFQKLGIRIPAIAAPTGIEAEEYLPEFQCFGKKSISFIGALDWMPNQEAVGWMLDNVWEKVRRRHPQAEFHIAGKNTPAWLSKKTVLGVFFHGEVPDAKAFFNEHPVLVVPLFSGSGIKIKILEGMALGRVVVCTLLAAAGIPATPGRHFLTAENADGFVDRICECFENQELVRQISANAMQFIREHFDNRRLGKKVFDFYQSLKKH